MPGDTREERSTESDRPRANHERPASGRRERPADRVGADRQELDGRRFRQAQASGRIEIGGRHEDALAHGAVAMDAEHLDIGAAVGLALAAGRAASAAQIGVDDDARALFERHAAAGPDHGGGDLVAHDARIVEIGMLAFVDVIVGPAYADLPNLEQRPSIAGCARLRQVVDKLELTRCRADQTTHA